MESSRGGPRQRRIVAPLRTMHAPPPTTTCQRSKDRQLSTVSSTCPGAVCTPPLFCRRFPLSHFAGAGVDQTVRHQPQDSHGRAATLGYRLGFGLFFYGSQHLCAGMRLAGGGGG
ncbi:hypothetical protein AVEN_260580-1 [Araneus ventricosus]|uniref:Uncharacterized protein n=1 Tax=Araneus ventricosus TaxID=182803 RepID=A0A4Y2M5D8_ARAVE|nr:hypothetical protein AVEN_260580-1 [Araneus ventricosus]